MKEKLRVEVENGQVLCKKMVLSQKIMLCPKIVMLVKNLDKRLQKYTGGASKI